MAHIEVGKLSSQEVAELACTYAALILHDDDQDVTGTLVVIKVTRSANSSMPQESRSKLTGLNFLLRLSMERISVPFLTSEALLAPHPHPQLLLPQWLRRKLKRKLKRKEPKSNRRRRRLLLPHPLLKRKTWIWATSLVDSLSDQ